MGKYNRLVARCHSETSRWLTKGTLVKIANALEVDVHELFIPSAEENTTTKTAYAAITQKVILQVKEAVEKTLDSMNVE